ncbi:YiiX/YebB-like N1pC/P60 family cysteine hydrolase [Coraliomargarita parva]|uniref:YiiX/YebB-like N1pC/P60 family cysteine hydrolase n=1 Tax=Coraliomargarita parva TaxID=3014050 RepID=UPI0022B3C34A|nr:YiiX/YebB-like N1pC/P60 family cysteine hydrolase [Coraliomargarita parva]
MTEPAAHVVDPLSYVPVVLAAAESLPREAEVRSYMDAFAAAETRGYFLPDEDERLREIYARYLAVRTSLLECVRAISAGKYQADATPSLEAFLVAFSAATILVRSASYLVALAEAHPLVKVKLDEAEPRYGLERNSFTQVYKSLTSPRRWWGFDDAVHYFRRHREGIEALESHEDLRPLVGLIRGEEAFFSARREDFLQSRLRYRIHSYLRRRRSGYQKTMFQLFRISGSAIAELKQPFVKPRGAGKRVTPEIRARLESFLQPGDVLVTRHDDAVSNLFLPGFWPHAAFYIGSNHQRARLGLEPHEGIGEDIRFLEAKKDGVRLRPPEDTLQVDAFTVLRPQLAAEAVALVIARGLTHAGKLYDFIFDFSSADRLACTELVYRSYHGVADVRFELQPHAGRVCLSAEDLINQAVGAGYFEPVLVYGLDGDSWVEGPDAQVQLRQSFASRF